MGIGRADGSRAALETALDRHVTSSLGPAVGHRLTAVAILLLLLATTTSARILLPSDAEQTAREPVLAQLTAAFDAGDHQTLADLVDPGGVRLELSPAADRSTELLPAQAFYYFRNLFEGRQTVRFEIEKSQSTGDTRLHAMAVWRYERTDVGGAEERRLLFTLTGGPGNWRLIEITALRGD